MANWTARRIAREAGILAGTVLLLASARSSLAEPYHVPTGSMEPSIEVGDHIVVDKLAYGVRVPFTNTYAVSFAGPHVGDVVVLDSPEEDKVLVKRVVAGPGQTVEVRDGHVVLDGVEEPLAPASLAAGTGPDYGPETLPDDRYFVLGDNRGDSHDSRFFGAVSRSAILGHAMGVYWRSGPAWDGL
jgi:signal peptidase I|nr:signal peptidase I [Kofleriaceae bacterium]